MAKKAAAAEVVRRVMVRYPDGGEPVEVLVVRGRRNPWGPEYLICIPSHSDPDTSTRFLSLDGFSSYVRDQVQAQIGE